MEYSLRALLALVIAPSSLFATVLAILSSYARTKRPRPLAIKATPETEVPFTPLLAEPAPRNTMVRQRMSAENEERLRAGGVLDGDVAFLAGQTAMPLSVYEGPLMSAYRRFRALRKSSQADSYYVVEKRRGQSPRGGRVFPRQSSAVRTDRPDFKAVLPSEEESGESGGEEDVDVVLLYGRGPAFEVGYDEDGFAGLDD